MVSQNIKKTLVFHLINAFRLKNELGAQASRSYDNDEGSEGVAEAERVLDFRRL